MSERMNGTSTTSNVIPKLELVSSTANPIGTIFSIWHNSRNSQKVIANEIQDIYNGVVRGYFELRKYIVDTYSEYDDPNLMDLSSRSKKIIQTVVELAIKLDVPASEFVSYEFVVENANVAWREQLVRARDLHVWMQTSRTANLEYFDAVRMESIDNAGDEAVQIYNEAVQNIRNTYNKLVELGVPSEDIRLIPQSMLHRVMFGGNLRSILRLVGKRTSWIAQSSLWSPIISDILKILTDTLGSWILNYTQDKSVTVKDGKIVEYKAINECMDRYTGKDPLPIDPRYLSFTGKIMPEHTNIELYDRMKSMFINMWSDDILKILGWDRSNPSKIGPYDRPVNL